MQTVDLAKTALRELNQALHHLREGPTRPTGRCSTRRARMRSRSASTRRSASRCKGSVGYYCAGMNKRGDDHRGRHRRAGRRREHDVGHGRREGRRQPVCRRHRPRRAARHRGQRLVALRHLDEGHRHRRARQYRPHVGLHGAVGQPRRARRRRRRARRFHLRGAALRARRGEEPRRRLHREGDARRSISSCSSALLEKAGVDGVAPEEFRRYGSARKLYNFNIDNADAY